MSKKTIHQSGPLTEDELDDIQDRFCNWGGQLEEDSAHAAVIKLMAHIGYMERAQPPRGGDAAEEELVALLERLTNVKSGELGTNDSPGTYLGLTVQRRYQGGFCAELGLDGDGTGATPLAALRALDAALAEQQQQKSEEEV